MWTSVDTQLPNPGVYVLCWTPDLGGQFIIARYFANQPKGSEWQATYRGSNKRFGTRKNNQGTGITKWQPLTPPDDE